MDARRLRYLGPHRRVRLQALGVAVDRGGLVDVPADLADRLLEQPASWEDATHNAVIGEEVVHPGGDWPVAPAPADAYPPGDGEALDDAGEPDEPADPAGPAVIEQPTHFATDQED